MAQVRKMKIKQVLNNNVAVTSNNLNEEIIVMGKGLAFQKRRGDTIDEEKIEKTFVLKDKETTMKLVELMKDVSDVYLDLSSRIIELAKSELTYELDDYLYIALTDHLSFAITRHKKGIELKNHLMWEIRKYYKREFQVALQALDIVEEEIGVRLPEDEAASIALHFVNSQLSGKNVMTAVKVTELVNNILKIVKYHFKIELDETSINYERFLTHIRFFAMRLLQNERLQDMYDQFFYDQMMKKFPESFECTTRIAAFIKDEYDWEISNDEKIYLTLHIHRITNRYGMS